jgi:hypothetical protein
MFTCPTNFAGGGGGGGSSKEKAEVKIDREGVARRMEVVAKWGKVNEI